MFQQQAYKLAYQDADSEYGIPDRKITLGHATAGQRILSVGCGAGADIWYLAGNNFVAGLDFVASGLRVALRHGVAGVVGDLNLHPALPFQDQSFDLVICKDILEHLLQPLAILEEVRRVLRLGGRVVISVPNHFQIAMRLRILLGCGIIYRSLIDGHNSIYDEWNYMHVRFFTYRGFRSFLKVAGFCAEKWFWDFGNLSHYHDPDMWMEPQLWKLSHGKAISPRGRIGLYLIRPIWRLLNLVFPRWLRSAIVSLAPGLLCGVFYVIVVVPDHRDVRIS